MFTKQKYDKNLNYVVFCICVVLYTEHEVHVLATTVEQQHIVWSALPACTNNLFII